MKPFIPSKIAEYIFAICLLVFAYNHFKGADMMGAWVPKFMPGDGKIWIYVTGAGLALAAIAILTGIQKTLACYLLAAMLLIFVFAMHIKNFDKDSSGVLKDTAIAMAAILIGNRSSGS
jgi:uncharacterized membrane protein YphA (DoxX/SURF4 family)